MNCSKIVGISMAALAAASCGGGAEDGEGGGAPAEDSPVDHHPADVSALLSRAGRTSNDHPLMGGLGEHEFSCEGDIWSLRVFYGPARPPPLDSLVLVAWDMPAGTFKGWAFAKEADDPSYWSMKLSAEEAGFGCDERYTTSFFFLA